MRTASTAISYWNLSEHPRDIPASTRNYEPWFGMECRALAPTSWSYRFFASADLRFRTVYDYHRASDEDEDVGPSLNIILGFRSPGVESGTRVLREMYLRVYHGVNPHGQFRTQKDYTYFGAGFRFGFDF